MVLNLLTGYCIEPFIWFRHENVFCDGYLLQPIHFFISKSFDVTFLYIPTIAT